jgi:HSP20 family protein
MSALIRYETPSTISDIVESIFNNGFFSRWDRELPSTNYPDVDIIEDKDAFRIRADMPGMEKNDIKVEVENGVLSISGEKKAEKMEKDKNHYYHFERSYGAFNRTFRLPENVMSDHVDAKYTNGVLELTLKKSEVAKPKAIEVKVE